METVRKPRVDNTKKVLLVGMSRQGAARQTSLFLYNQHEGKENKEKKNVIN